MHAVVLLMDVHIYRRRQEHHGFVYRVVADT